MAKSVAELTASECADLEELRKLAPSTAFNLMQALQDAKTSRKEDHETMIRLGEGIRADIQSIFATQMATIATLLEGFRTDMREQHKRIVALEADMRTVKERLDIPA